MVPVDTPTGWEGVEADVYEHIHNDVNRIKQHELENIKLIEERNSDIKISFEIHLEFLSYVSSISTIIKTQKKCSASFFLL